MFVLKKHFIWLTFLVLVVFSCKKLVDHPNETVSSELLTLGNEPANYGTHNDAVAELGRVLFYDEVLSASNGISCGSCHLQEFAFADRVVASEGFEKKLTPRNTPPIQNLSLHGQSLFWDGRSENLVEMVTMPVLNHLEMGIREKSDMVKQVKLLSYYKPLFQRAYNSDEINFEKISDALSLFVSSMQSRRSKFDRSLQGTSTLSALEQQGKDLFFGKYNCGSCHNLFDPIGYDDVGFEQNGSGNMVNIGLDKVYQDQGLAEITGRESDQGKFKIPNLRNVMLTAPYMHDGRFDNIRDVILHYTEGLSQHPNLDHRLKDPQGNPQQIPVSETDLRALESFMHSLSDFEFVSDPKFSNPFK